MKISVNSYSFGGAAAQTPETLADALRSAAEWGYDGFELTDGPWSSCDNAAEVLKKASEEAGIPLVCYCIGADFLRNDPETELKMVYEKLLLAKQLGVPMMRHDLSSGLPGKLSAEDFSQALPILVEYAKKSADMAKSLGITVLTENHGYFCQDADRVGAVIRGVGRENFRLLADIGNFMCADEYPPESLGKVFDLVAHVHAKDFYKYDSRPEDRACFHTRSGAFLEGCVAGEGDAGVSESIEILKNKGYDGWLSLEYEGNGDRAECIKRGLASLRRLIG